MSNTIPRSISDAPTNGSPVRVWCETSVGDAAWFDARYNDGVWRESIIHYVGRGFEERGGRVLLPTLFVPATPPPRGNPTMKSRPITPTLADILAGAKRAAARVARWPKWKRELK